MHFVADAAGSRAGPPLCTRAAFGIEGKSTGREPINAERRNWLRCACHSAQFYKEGFRSCIQRAEDL
jgi:hypothetical protein